MENESDMLVLLEAYRLKEITADSVTGSIDLHAIFRWLATKTITQAEFEELMSAQEVQEIVLEKDLTTDPLLELQTEKKKIAELRTRMSKFHNRTETESLAPSLVTEWCSPPDAEISGI